MQHDLGLLLHLGEAWVKKTKAVPMRDRLRSFGAAARKPNSVALGGLSAQGGGHLSGPRVAARLERPTRGSWRAGPALSAYLVLLPVGFALPPESPRTRCALTAPFHPYRLKRWGVRSGVPLPTPHLNYRRYLFCCTFRRIAPPRCYRAPCPGKPAYSRLPAVRTFLTRLAEKICQAGAAASAAATDKSITC